MIIVFKFIKESLSFALNALRSNKLRTALTLSGVTIGIFSIITVFTLIDFLEKKIRESVQSLGENVVYIQKWPWTPPEGESEYPWWRYLSRPIPTIAEQKTINRKSQLTESSCFIISAKRKLLFENNSYNEVSTFGVSHTFDQCWSFELAQGRYFSPFESKNGANVVVLGADIASELFQDENPIGKRIKIMGRKVAVIGVLLKEGDDMFGNSLDKNAILPINYAKGLFNVRSERVNPFIIAKAKEGVSIEDLKAELEGILRAERRIKPSEENNFALNQVTIVQKQFDSLFSVIDIAGWLIGGFSILVGGFGIANIMFVSVKERTRIIGIQKALGAKRKFILWQFLFESIFLSLIGGSIGLLIVFLIAAAVNSSMDIGLSLTFFNIFRGVSISVALGIISGFIPANSASKLNPVVAINYQ